MNQTIFLTPEKQKALQLSQLRQQERDYASVQEFMRLAHWYRKTMPAIDDEIFEKTMSRIFRNRKPALLRVVLRSEKFVPFFRKAIRYTLQCHARDHGITLPYSDAHSSTSVQQHPDRHQIFQRLKRLTLPQQQLVWDHAIAGIPLTQLASEAGTERKQMSRQYKHCLQILRQ